MMQERNDLENLAVALFNAKRDEDEAKKARIKAEEELADAIGGSDNGSTSAQCGSLKVTIKRGWNYKIDAPKQFAIDFPDFVRERVEIAAGAYEEQRKQNSDLFVRMSQHVTATPKKVSVELKA